MRWGTELLRTTAPSRGGAPPYLPSRTAHDVPAGFAGGWRLTVPVADTSAYLPWLVARLEQLGGTLTRALAARRCRPRGSWSTAPAWPPAR